MRLRGLPPIISAASRTLILGSFPSQASLAARQYYGHRQNQFWRILAGVTGEPLTEMDYAAKQAAVLRAGLAIWDAYGSCVREGSLDSAIRESCPNDFRKLKKLAPRLERICFNGQTAGKLSRELAAEGYETCILPSTSPAYTLAFSAKLAAWQKAWAS